MKRILPFVIILVVAGLTIGAGAILYRAKLHPPGPATSAPIPQSDDNSAHVRGVSNAPVTLEVYGDFQCPSCATASATIDDLQKTYSRNLRVIFREFPLAMHSHAMEAAMAAEAAGIQGKFWEMHDLLYRYQDVWSKASQPQRFFEMYAQLIGIDVARFRADCIADDIRARIKSEGEGGEARGVRNTPTIFINGRMASVFTRTALEAEIKSTLAGKTKS